MRKHEILAAIVEMWFVNCKLCDKAVYSKMNDTNSLVHTKWNVSDICCEPELTNKKPTILPAFYCYFLCEAFFLIKVVSCVIMKIKLLEDI